MKQTKKNSLTSRLAKLGYVAPAAFVLSLSAFSLNAVATPPAGNDPTPVAPVAPVAKDAAFLLEAFGADATKGNSLHAFYLSSRDATRGLLSADFLKALDGDLFIQANGLRKDIRFDSQLAKNADTQKGALLRSLGGGVVLGTNLATLSTDGTNKLALGAFGGFGFVKLSAFADASTFTGEPTAPTAIPANAFASDFEANVKGFGGGLFFAFKGDADAKTGLFANGSISFDKFEHNFSKIKADKTFEAFATIEPKTIRADLAVGFVAELPEIGGCALFATPNAKISVARSVNLESLKDEKADTKAEFIKDIQAGVKLSAVLQDGAFEPFISVDGLLSDQFKDETAGVDIKGGDAIKAIKLSGGLKFALADNFTLSGEIGAAKPFLDDKAANPKPVDGLLDFGDLSAKLGLSYLF